MVCKFGDKASKAVYVSSEVVICASPPSSRKDVMFWISLNGQDWTMTLLKYVYVDVRVKSMVPAIGTTSGGTTVLVSFDQSEEFRFSSFFCKFDSEIVIMTLLSATSGWCVTPPRYSDGFADVSISWNLQDFHPCGLQFLFVKPMAIETFQPSHGSTLGQTPINIIGSAFTRHSSLQCRFGNSELTSIVTWTSSSRISCLTTPSPVGHVNVSVSNNGMDWVHSKDKYQYQSHLILSSLTPSAGPEFGSSSVTIYGVNIAFSKSLACKFGSFLVFANWFSSHMIVCTAPSIVPNLLDSSKVVDLYVTANGVEFSHESLQFTYYTPCNIISVVPSSAPAMNGETTIEVTLESAESLQDPFWSWVCLFGQTKSQALKISGSMNPVRVACLAPAQNDGMVSLSVTRNEQACGLFCFCFNVVCNVLKILFTGSGRLCGI
jgi:hypothetical protein